MGRPGTRKRISAVCLAVAAACASAGAASASAKSMQLRDQVTEELVEPGSQFSMELAWSVQDSESFGYCTGTDYETEVAKDPSASLKILATDTDLVSKACFAEAGHHGGSEAHQVSGALFLKDATVKFLPKAGVEWTFVLKGTIELTDGCKYEVKKLARADAEEAQAVSYSELAGTVNLQKHTGSPPACAKTLSAGLSWVRIESEEGEESNEFRLEYFR